MSFSRNYVTYSNVIDIAVMVTAPIFTLKAGFWQLLSKSLQGIFLLFRHERRRDMKKSVKPWLSGTLMVSMVLGSAQLQASAAGVGAFKDLNASHNWGLKAIAKMASTGVIAGEPNGSFLPDNSVTQEQAITMVVNELGLKAEVQAYNVKDYNLSYKSVSNWAKPYVAIADKHHLLLANEASRFSGTHSASRQWVAQLLVRMIGKEDEAAKYNDSTTSFADKNDISSWASSYVNLAASSDYGLINGSKNKDGSYSFNPTDPIKRIELAVLLDKAEKYLPSMPASEVQGQVTSIQGNTLTVKTGDGDTKFFLDADTWVFENGQKTTASAIQPFQPVLLVGSPTASYVEILDAATLQQQVTGTVVKVYKDMNTLVVKDSSGALQSYKVDNQVVYKSKQGAALTLEDIAENDSVQVTLTGGKVTAVNKLNDQSQVNGSVTIYDVDLKNSLLTVQVGSNIQPYALGDKVEVTYPDGRTDGVAGLTKGMTVELGLTDNTVSSIKVDTIVEQGTVKAVSADSSIVTYETNDGHLKAYKVLSNASIQIQGTVAALTDVQVGDQMVAEMNADGISSLKVTNRTIDSSNTSTNNYIQGSIIGVDTSSATKTLFMKLQDSGEIKSYEFGSTYNVYVDGNLTSDLSQLKKDQLASIQLYDGKISYLSVDNRLQAKVLRVDTTNRLLTVVMPDNEQLSYVVDPDCDVNIANQSNDSLSDLVPNDVIRFKLSDTKIITQIDVQRQFNYKVTSVSGNNIDTVDDRNNDRNLYISGSVDFTIPGVTAPKVSDVNPNDLVQVTYVGEDLKSVQVKALTRGIVTGVDTDANQVTIKQFEGSTATVPFQSNAVINRNSQQSSQLSSLAVGDRVEVSYQLDGSEAISVMQPIDGTFNYYDNYYVYTTDGNTRYQYAYNVYVHQGTNEFYFNNLTSGDKIKLYKLGNYVYEVEKVN
jgi:trimeric autotransporter adhesin